jgi:tungstate transport system substrate-binding protein
MCKGGAMNCGRLCVLTLVILLLSASISFSQERCAAGYGSGANKFSLATGSPAEVGILKVLREEFAKDNDASLCWIKQGSGDSLSLLKAKKADMIMVRAPAAKKKVVADGWAAKRVFIGSNEFYIVGPADDPAKI